MRLAVTLNTAKKKQSASAIALHGLCRVPIDGKMLLDLQEMTLLISFMRLCKRFMLVCVDPVIENGTECFKHY